MADRSEQIDSILAAAVELPEANDRANYIRHACGGDGELERQITELVDAYLNAGDFLEFPAPSLSPTIDLGLAESVGTQLGRYKLLQQIGEGGFAVVFMAEQEQPVRRRVAVKIIKPGMDSRQVIARFEAERQALALMDHSNIAKVLDAGTTESGLPYFVMELVKGTPITDYCDEHHLSIDERLALFSQVCDAVQHAHQKGVIHRDIKPSNVLVRTEDDKPLVKVIDFGIAKATEARLTDRTLFTDFRQLIGTPAYMSPEQAEGSLDIDTRSDVYSLGVLLYELMTASPPFDPQELRSKSICELQRTLREVEPPKPSTRVVSFEQDARSVKARQRLCAPNRWTHVLKGDIDWIVMRAIEKDRGRRYQTVGELSDDVTRRLNNEVVTAAAPSTLYRIAKFTQRHRWQALAMGALVIGALIGITGMAVALVSQARERAEMQINLAIAAQSLDEWEKAEALYRETLARPADDTLNSRQQRARVQLRLAQVIYVRHGALQAEPYYREAAASHRAAFRANDPNIALVLIDFGILERDGLKKYHDAELLFREALEIYRSAKPLDRYRLAQGLLYVGNVRAFQNDFTGADQFFRQSLQEYETAGNDLALALARLEYSLILVQLKRYADAEEVLLKAEPVLKHHPSSHFFGAGALTSLYAYWDRTEPDQGYDAKSREWATRILGNYYQIGLDLDSDPD
jgi:tRNA A-37 threonylcarbamoyl transferase component Bud32/tetratricopeptide (TPR) repeat protein